MNSLKYLFPPGVSVPLIYSYVPKEFENLQGFLVYSISSNRSASEIRKFLNEHILIPLKSIDGISDIQIRGGSDRIINILIDYNKVRTLNISNNEINDAIRKVEIITAAGKIENKNYQIYVNIKNDIKDLDVIRNQAIKKLFNGQVIRIKDIAEVFEDVKEPQSYYRVNGKETVNLIISKEQGANIFKVADNVKNKLQELSKTFPSDFIIIKEIDKSEEMQSEINSLLQNGIFSIFILFIILFVIFKNLRYPTIIISSICFTLCISFILFYLFRITLNIITVTCFIVSIGLIVHYSIVVLDYLDNLYDGEGEKYLSVYVKEIFYPLFVSTIIMVAIFIPLIYLTDELKPFFKYFTLALGSSLFASLIISTTEVPFFYLIVYKSKKMY